MKRSGIERKAPLARGSKPLKRTGRLPFRSVKRAREYVTRRKVVAELMPEGTVCAARLSMCSGWATDPHELLSRGRGGSITDRSNIVPLCRPCHTHITENPAWAEANGWARKTGTPTSYGEARA